MKNDVNQNRLRSHPMTEREREQRKKTRDKKLVDFLREMKKTERSNRNEHL